MYKKYISKIMKDLLTASVATYFILLIPELILPGTVSTHFNPKYLLIFILVLGLIFSKLGEKINQPEKPKFQAISRNLINIILFVIALMLILGLYKMKIWEIAIVIAIAIPLLIGAENILIKEE